MILALPKCITRLCETKLGSLIRPPSLAQFRPTAAPGAWRTVPTNGCPDVSVEDLADLAVGRPCGVPAELAGATRPRQSPAGRRVCFVDAPVDDIADLLRDLPRSVCALARRAEVDDPARDAFRRIVEQEVATGPRAGRAAR
jgi:hypothetical protein